MYVTKAKDAGKNPVFRCASCQLSETKRDQIAREARLQREKEAQQAFEQNGEVLNQPLEDTADPMCCAAKILSLQSDFANEKPLLQKVIEEAGHICVFLPKFHCELNPIELYWAFIKHYYRKYSIHCKSFSHCKALFEKVRKICPVSIIRKYFRKIDRQMDIY